MPPELIWHADPFPWGPFLVTMGVIIGVLSLVVYIVERIRDKE